MDELPERLPEGFRAHVAGGAFDVGDAFAADLAGQAGVPAVRAFPHRAEVHEDLELVRDQLDEQALLADFAAIPEVFEPRDPVPEDEPQRRIVAQAQSFAEALPDERLSPPRRFPF